MEEPRWVGICISFDLATLMVVMGIVVFIDIRRSLSGKDAELTGRIGKPLSLALLFFMGYVFLSVPDTTALAITLRKVDVIFTFLMTGWLMHKWRKELKKEVIDVIAFLRIKFGRCFKKASDYLLKSSEAK